MGLLIVGVTRGPSVSWRFTEGLFISMLGGVGWFWPGSGPSRARFWARSLYDSYSERSHPGAGLLDERSWSDDAYSFP